MIVGFKINLGNFQMMSVESSEHDNWEDCMREVFNFLKKLDHPKVQAFVKDIMGIKMRAEIKARVSK